MFNRKITHWLSDLDAHHRLAISMAFAGLALLVLKGRMALRTEVIATWDAFALCVLALAWTRILTAKPRVVVRLATLAPASRKVLFLFVMVAACASLGSVAVLLGLAKSMSGVHLAAHIALALTTVVLSWLLLHTIYALEYAHLFYRAHQCEGTTRLACGLIFPEGDINPDYFDFVYFAFVIGMTCQVSDVQISSREIRRWALLHGIVAFAFNTAVLALSINLLSGFL